MPTVFTTLVRAGWPQSRLLQSSRTRLNYTTMLKPRKLCDTFCGFSLRLRPRFSRFFRALVCDSVVLYFANCVHFDRRFRWDWMSARERKNWLEHSWRWTGDAAMRTVSVALGWIKSHGAVRFTIPLLTNTYPQVYKHTNRALYPTSTRLTCLHEHEMCRHVYFKDMRTGVRSSSTRARERPIGILSFGPHAHARAPTTVPVCEYANVARVLAAAWC